MKVCNEKSDEPISEELLNILYDIRKERNFNPDEYIDEKAKILNMYMNKYGLKACVVPTSGGIDSAVVLGIVKRASMQENSPIKKIIPLLLPVLKSSGASNQYEATDRGKELCDRLNIKPFVVDLTAVNNEMRNSLESVLEITGQDWAIGQLCAYSRTPMIYYTTSLLNQSGYGAIVCGTINNDEGAYLGYVGKASDGMVDVQVISDIHKSEVYQIVVKLDIPESIIKAIPSGDMYDGRTDEMVFGAPYNFVELYLYYLKLKDTDKINLLSNISEEAKKQFDFFANNLENLHRYNLHKYLSGSPAIHLDLYDSSIEGGWENYYEKTKKILSE